MLPEHKATSYANDPAQNTVMVMTDAGSRLQGDYDARILLDDKGHLVGVDVAPDKPERMVVMLGGHESVVSTIECRVRVEGGGRVMIQGTGAKAIAPGASPYVP